MESNEPIVELSVDDMTKVPSIKYKDFAALFNPFVTHTVKFLNRFACVCEEKLADLSLRIQQLEVTITLLETKLSSIPGLEDVKVESQPTSVQPEEQQPLVETNSEPSPQPAASESQAEVVQEEPEPPKPATKTVSEDPRYSKFFKMMKMGVPMGALRPKVLAEGLNPDYLDTPDAPAPEGGEVIDDDASVSEGSSTSSFSDDD